MDYSEIYETFVRLLEEGEIYKDKSPGFDDVCAALGVDKTGFNRYVISKTGMSGESVVKLFGK